MANYGKGKYKFSALIALCNKEASKAYLETKQREHFSGKNGCIEQWLYNQNAAEINQEFKGFIKGFMFGKRGFSDVDLIMTFADLLPALARIYKEMSSENDWGNSENLEDWEEILELYSLE